ncbi:hypothetical protein KEM56_003479 [Ascosphaera pollenicola]|nr:hypothetical protein KEM56_003479 [Ascosphaera pollenicola]
MSILMTDRNKIRKKCETVPSVFSNNGVVASSFQSSTVVDTVVTSLRPTEPGVYASPTITPDAGTISSPPMSIEPSPLSTTTPYIEFTPSSDIGALTSPLEPTVTPNTEIASLPSSSVRVSVPPSYPTTAPPSEYGDILSPSYPTNPADVEATSTPSPPISTPAVADETALISDVVPISTTSPQPLPSGYIATQSLLLASHTTPPIAAFTSSSHHKITPAVPTNKSLSLGNYVVSVATVSSSLIIKVD